jgi:Fe-S-cluster containining protein
MFGIESFEEEERLKKLEKKLGSARLKKVDHCIKCGFCCSKRTCIPTPDELVEIAKFLKTTSESLISTKFIVDRKSRLSSPYFVRPAASNILDLVGKFIPTKRTWNEGACVFLKNNECKIYDARPRSAKLQECWNGAKIPYAPSESWENNILKSKFGIDGSQLEDESNLQSDIDEGV